MRTEFIERYPLSDLKPADYNPRKLEPEKFAKLQESLRKFGVIKPVIVNGANGILTAGHQRTRAMKAIGMTHCPAIRINGINRTDEIRFNLFHNSIETNKTRVLVDVVATGQKPGSFMFIMPEVMHCERNANALVVKSMAELIIKYGEWGSIVIAPDGRVLLNSDYAMASVQTRCGCICYMLPEEQEEEMQEYLGEEYGQYYYDALGVKSYHQLHCQMHRLAGKKKRLITSTLYEELVIPRLKKTERTVDFGAGRCAYANALARQGYDIVPYEPHFQRQGKLDVQEVVRQIRVLERRFRAGGLMDCVVLDSVLNSVVNSHFEHAVLTTCNALLKPEGKIFVGTRSLLFCQRLLTYKVNSGHTRELQFLDKENFGATFRSGVWTMQHFHSPESLVELLGQYFRRVELACDRTNSQLRAVAREPLPLDRDKVLAAISEEFNMEYPGGYHHNCHNELVNILMKLFDNRAKLCK